MPLLLLIRYRRPSGPMEAPSAAAMAD
jgi:hypothetical protein